MHKASSKYAQGLLSKTVTLHINNIVRSQLLSCNILPLYQLGPSPTELEHLLNNLIYWRDQLLGARVNNLSCTKIHSRKYLGYADALNGSSQEESLQPKTKKQKIGSKRKAPFTSKEIEIKCMIETAARNNDPHTAFKAFDQAKSEGQHSSFL